MKWLEGIMADRLVDEILADKPGRVKRWVICRDNIGYRR